MDTSLAILGLIGTIVFGIVSVVLGLKALRPKQIAWGSVSETISTEDAGDDLSISHAGRQLTSVHITRLVFWNGGVAAFGGTEISHADPFCIDFPEGTEVLTTKVLGETSRGVAASSLKSTERSNSVILSFDTLNKDEGAVVQIVHCGEKTNIRLAGTIRDVVHFNWVDVRERTNQSATPRRVIVFSAIAIFAFTMVALRLALATFEISTEIPQYIAAGLGSLLFLIAIPLSLIELITRGPNTVPPNLLGSLLGPRLRATP